MIIMNLNDVTSHESEVVRRWPSVDQDVSMDTIAFIATSHHVQESAANALYGIWCYTVTYIILLLFSINSQHYARNVTLRYEFEEELGLLQTS